MKYALAAIYFARAMLILAFFLAPKTPAAFFLFAAGIGFTYLSTVPPTVGLVAKLLGVRYLATLFGIVMLSHQIGGFLGAWLGGKAFEATGAMTGCGWPTSRFAFSPRSSTCRSGKRAPCRQLRRPRLKSNNLRRLQWEHFSRFCTAWSSTRYERRAGSTHASA